MRREQQSRMLRTRAATVQNGLLIYCCGPLLPDVYSNRWSISSRSDGYLSVWKEFFEVSWPSRKRAKNGRLCSQSSGSRDSVLSRIEWISLRVELSCYNDAYDALKTLWDTRRFINSQKTERNNKILKIRPYFWTTDSLRSGDKLNVSRL